MIGVVVDVDDTLINTERRMQGVWRELLGREVPMQAVENLSLAQIFEKFASSDQKARANELRKRFWDISLCLENVGIELAELDEPIPFAAEVLQAWSKHCQLVYLTGRTENTRDLTLDQLRKFGFPTDNIRLIMFNLEDYARARGLNPSGPTVIDAKSRLFSSISKKHNVVRVVDDYPGYFPIYRQFDVPERIGFLRPKKYSQQQYIERGATRLIESWKELQDDLPKPL
ncbi:MAG: HAD family acid phosphatase [Candidatus Bathyarchaeota archaeon]|nr:HAD family acid phosphatase [Candidatus Bathyarchaeota archaeon]